MTFWYFYANIAYPVILQDEHRQSPPGGNYGRPAALDDPGGRGDRTLRGTGACHPRQEPERPEGSADRHRPRADVLLCVRGYRLHVLPAAQHRAAPASPTCQPMSTRRVNPWVELIVGIALLCASAGLVLVALRIAT